jgi:DNA-binding response OmpR family regulator
MTRSIHVLHVEDQLTITGFVERWLSTKPGFTVETVGTLADARGRLQVPPFVDIILLDLNLPDSQGVETVRTMVREFPNKPIVVYSGVDEGSTEGECIYAGAQDYLRKGASLDGLDSALRHAVIRHEVRGILKPAKESMKQLQRTVAQTPTCEEPK